MIRLQLTDRNGTVLETREGEGAIETAVDRVYQAGDCYVISGAEHMTVQLDACLDPAEVYAPLGSMHWEVPEGEALSAYCPQAFQGQRHLIRVREMPAERLPAVRPVSRNTHDLRGDTDFFPHASANIETRNEACFAARNVIDGLSTNRGHGEWPYGSWGIGTRQDAELTLDFGRSVAVRSVRILSRADFPHDAWFEGLTVWDDNGRARELKLCRSEDWQDFPLETVTRRLRFGNLKKADDPSPFPSLRGIEVMGKEM